MYDILLSLYLVFIIYISTSNRLIQLYLVVNKHVHEYDTINTVKNNNLIV